MRNSLIRNKLFWILCATFLLLTISVAWLYGTKPGFHLRLLAADTLLTTRQGEWAMLLLGPNGLKERRLYYEEQFDQMGLDRLSSGIVQLEGQEHSMSQAIRVEEIEGKPYQGYLLYVYDPTKLRIAVPDQVGSGETISSMVTRTGALAGVNAGGFLDPAHMGDGAVPLGIVISGGQLLFNSEADDTPSHVIGITQGGILLAGKYTPSELDDLDIREAVSFAPRLIHEGKGLIRNPQDGWGYAPRTAIAQLKDGTIVFAIVDGRQLHSVGATLYDIQQLFLELGAITAANLDGGASTELFKDGEIMNKPATRLGERPIPTVWIVLDTPASYIANNPWSGLDPAIIKASSK